MATALEQSFRFSGFGLDGIALLQNFVGDELIVVSSLLFLLTKSFPPRGLPFWAAWEVQTSDCRLRSDCLLAGYKLGRTLGDLTELR